MLYMNVVDVHKAVAHAAQVLVRPGNPPPEQSKPLRNSPTRTLRWFWPPDEGGREISPKDPEFLESRNRWGRFQLEQRCRPQLVANFRALKLYDAASIYLPKAAGDQLMVEALDLVLKFSTQPREMLLRGQAEPLLKRLNRVGRALEEAELMEPAELQGDIANWRDLAKKAYLGMQRGDPQAVEKMKSLWGDGYFATLLDLNVELDPRKFDEPVKPGRKKGQSQSAHAHDLRRLQGCAGPECRLHMGDVFSRRIRSEASAGRFAESQQQGFQRGPAAPGSPGPTPSVTGTSSSIASR